MMAQVEGQQIPAEFTYSVTWRETTVPFEKRMDKYRRYQFLPQHLEVRIALGSTVGRGVDRGESQRWADWKHIGRMSWGATSGICIE